MDKKLYEIPEDLKNLQYCLFLIGKHHGRKNLQEALRKAFLKENSEDYLVSEMKKLIRRLKRMKKNYLIEYLQIFMNNGDFQEFYKQFEK